MFAGNIGRDDNALLAPAANSGAEKVKIKVDDGKMTNDLDYLGVEIDSYSASTDLLSLPDFSHECRTS